MDLIGQVIFLFAPSPCPFLSKPYLAYLLYLCPSLGISCHKLECGLAKKGHGNAVIKNKREAIVTGPQLRVVRGLIPSLAEILPPP